MYVYEIRNLLNDKIKKIEVPEDIKLCLQVFKNKVKENSEDEITDIDIFYAGYILANPILREEFLKEEKIRIRVENKVDNRYSK